MKNLKKSLALVLVLVLALGMVPFAAASGPADMNVTDYSDYNSIEYKEAVDVLTALGVLQGDQGIFRPADTITRAEAAKIIAYVRLGNTTAEALPVMTNNTFDDVRPDHWANKFVEYGAVQGIIGGFGDGTFRPEDPVTAIQMGKMLLAALGYGVNGEFEGTGWEIAVVDRARHPDVNVLVGTGEVDYSAPATREEVAHYTFNSLHRTWMVSWNSTINDYSFWSQTVGGIENRPTLGFSTFRLVQVFEFDGYGIGGRVWEIATNRRQLTEWYQTDRILGTSTNGTPIDVMNRNSRSLTVRGRAGFVAELSARWVSPGAGLADVWTDFTYADIPIFVNGIAVGAADAVVDRDEAFQLAATSGVIVILCDAGPEDFHNGRIDRIVIIAKTVHEAGGSPSVASNGNVTISGVRNAALQFRQTTDNTGIYGTTNAAVRIPAATAQFLTPEVVNVRADELLYPDDIVRGDVLLVHQAFIDGVYTTIVEKADSITGQMTDARLAVPSNITFGGQTYGQSGLTPGALFNLAPATPALTSTWIANQDAPFAQPATGHNFDTDATIWLDDNGTVVRAKRVDAAPAIWGLVIGYETSGTLQGSMSVRLTTADGTTDVYPVSLRSNQTVAGITTELSRGLRDLDLAGATHTARMAYIVSYALLDDGSVQLTFAGATTAGDGLGTRVPNTAPFVPGSSAVGGAGAVDTTNYDRQTTRITLTDGTPAARIMTGNTAVFYFDTGASYSSIAPVNEPTAGIGANSAVTDVDIGTPTGFIMSSVTGLQDNVVAVWFDMVNTNAGGERFAFLTSVASIHSGNDRGTGWFDFSVFVPGGTPNTLRAEANNAFSAPGGTGPQPPFANTYGIGFYEYRLSLTTGRISSIDTPTIPGFFNTGWTNTLTAQISYADAGVIRTIGNGELLIDENTRFYSVNYTNTARTTADVIDFDRGDFLNLPEQIANVEFYVIGAQPATRNTDPIVAVYIAEISVATPDPDIVLNFASITGFASGTGLLPLASDTSIPGDLTAQPATITSATGYSAGAGVWGGLAAGDLIPVAGTNFTYTIVLTALAGYTFTGSDITATSFNAPSSTSNAVNAGNTLTITWTYTAT